MREVLHNSSNSSRNKNEQLRIQPVLVIASEHCIMVFVYFCVCKYTLNLQLLVFVLLTLNFMNINFRPLGFYVLWSKEHAIVNKTVLKSQEYESKVNHYEAFDGSYIEGRM